VKLCSESQQVVILFFGLFSDSFCKLHKNERNVKIIVFLKFIELSPKCSKCSLEIDDLRKIIIKFYLEEYLGIDIQIKVVDFEFQIPSVWLDSPMLSPMYVFLVLKGKL